MIHTKILKCRDKLLPWEGGGLPYESEGVTPYCFGGLKHTEIECNNCLSSKKTRHLSISLGSQIKPEPCPVWSPLGV